MTAHTRFVVRQTKKLHSWAVLPFRAVGQLGDDPCRKSLLILVVTTRFPKHRWLKKL